jgi:hypothetical protein
MPGAWCDSRFRQAQPKVVLAYEFQYYFGEIVAQFERLLSTH